MVSVICLLIMLGVEIGASRAFFYTAGLILVCEIFVTINRILEKNK